jgi:cold shock CspA family protein
MEHYGRVINFGLKGYGFLDDDSEENGRGIFFHIRDTISDPTAIKNGARVSYRLSERDGRPCAVCVEVLLEGLPDE